MGEGRVCGAEAAGAFLWGVGGVRGAAGCEASGVPGAWLSGDHACRVRGAAQLGHARARPGGPSPRVRGAAPCFGGGRGCSGTIPAGAGSRPPSPSPSPLAEDHPCGCGEQPTALSAIIWAMGPSPRVRGAAAVGRPVAALAGTIPAGAGSRIMAARRMWGSWDHPRGCGEQCSRQLYGNLPPGPSPRVRGAEPPQDGCHGCSGTIPAGAGSRVTTTRTLQATGDHPRGCEEQHLGTASQNLKGGPSPRVRGAAPQAPARVAGTGTIPAGAGSSTSTRRRAGASRDHPRGCGEQMRERWDESSRRGPSPRVRGAGPWTFVPRPR